MSVYGAKPFRPPQTIPHNYRAPNVIPTAFGPNRQRTLIVHLSSGPATATWAKHNGIWRCHRADPPLSWMVNTHPIQALKRLEHQALLYEWQPLNLSQAAGEKSATAG